MHQCHVKETSANSVDPDQMLQKVESDQGLLFVLKTNYFSDGNA